MKKLIALLLALVMVVGLFAACNTTKPEDTKGNDPQPTAGNDSTKPTEGTPVATESETPMVIQWDQGNGTDRVENPNTEGSLSYHTHMMWVPFYYSDQSYASSAPEYYTWMLATGYERAADNSWIKMTIRDDALWSDGKPITMDDILFTIKAMILDPTSTSVGYFKDVVGYDDLVNGKADELTGIVVEGNTITFNLATPNASFMPTIWTLPAHCFEGIDWADIATAPYWSAPVTSGPYKFVEASFPDWMKLTRSETYFGLPAGIKNVTCISYEAATVDAAVAAMIAGTDHITTRTVTTNGIIANQIVDGNPDVVIKSMYSNNIRALTFNTGDRADGKNKELLYTDPNVRLAISLLVDEDTIGAYAAGDACKVLGNPKNANTTHECDNVNKSLDLEKAKKLLDDAGWDYETVIEIVCYYTDQVSLDVLEIIKADAAKIGVQMKVVMAVDNSNEVIYEQKNWDIMFYQAAGSFNNPAWAITAQLKTGSGFTWLAKKPEIGEKYDALIAALNAEQPGTEAYTKGVHALQKANFEDNWIIPIYVNATVMTYNAAVLEIPETAFDYYDNNLNFHEWKMLK